MADPFDISEVLPPSVAGDEQVEWMAEALAQAEIDTEIPAVMRHYVQEANDPPHAILDAIAAHFAVDIWDQDWSKGQKQDNLMQVLRWHELKGTPEGIRRTFERLGAPYVRVFEPWESRWAYYQDQRLLDDQPLDEEPLDFDPNAFFRDPSLSPYEYWAAVRPGWGPASDYARALGLTERLSASRVALTVASADAQRAVTNPVSGKESPGIEVEGPGGEYVVSGHPEPEYWGLSAWVDVEPSSMTSEAVVLAVWKDTYNHMGLRRSGSTSDFELYSVRSGSLDATSAPFSLPGGWAYLTILKDGGVLAALEGDTEKASINAPPVGSGWRFALGSRPGSSNGSPTHHTNTRFSDQIVWRRPPSGEDLTEQAGTARSLPRETAGAWPALPRDRT